MLLRDVSSDLEHLSARVKDLERRLSALEKGPQTDFAESNPEAAPSAVPVVRSDAPPSPSQPNVLSILGKSVLGIAGAYLLRATAESGTFPSIISVTLALAYAAGWMVWAAWPRVHGTLARYSYALTAALILSPMLWEVTVRFEIMRAPATAAVLLGFAVLAMALWWRAEGTRILWVEMVALILTALVLIPGTRAPIPFTLALLAMASLIEIAAIRGRWRGLRPVVAAAADIATVIPIVILGDTTTIPAEYHAARVSTLIGVAAALWGIYAVSLATRSLVFRWRIAILEAAQFIIAASLAGWAVLRVTHDAGEFALGVSCLILGVACYAVAFGISALRSALANRHFYSACGVGLVIAGSWLTLPTGPLVIWFCLAAVIATGLGVRMRNPLLDVHGAVYLCGAFLISGLMEYAGHALAGSYPHSPSAAIVAAAATSLFCAGQVFRYPGEHLGERVLRALPAILAIYAMTALAVSGLIALVAAGTTPTLPQLAVIRTLVTCAAALLLAFVGATGKRFELVWMAYAAAVLGCLKLVFEDLRIGSTQSLAASLLIYGAVLILIPRLVRLRKRQA